MADDERQEMLEVLGGLLEWEAQQGGWEAPCWTRARRLRDLLSEQLAAPALHPGLWTGVLWERRIQEKLMEVYELEDDLSESVAAGDWAAVNERAWLGAAREVLIGMVDRYYRQYGQLPTGWRALGDIPPRPTDER